MGSLIGSGRLVEAILVLTLFEWCALAIFHRRTGRGVAQSDFAANLLSGMFLLVALREALVGAWWGWVAAGLTGALAAHLVDLGRRWRG